MSCYVRKAVSLASWNLKLQSRQLVNLIYPHTSVLGCLGIPAGLLLLLLGTVLWLLVFTLLPLLLIFVWMALQPYRLWLYLKNHMTGKHFSG